MGAIRTSAARARGMSVTVRTSSFRRRMAEFSLAVDRARYCSASGGEWERETLPSISTELSQVRNVGDGRDNR